MTQEAQNQHTFVPLMFMENEMPRGLATSRMIPVSRSRPAKMPTDLYFVETQCAERHIKIGIASNIKDRLSTIRTHCPYPIKLLKLVPGGAHMEKEIHVRFSHDLLTGEWFRRSDKLLELIDALDGVSDIAPPVYEIDFDNMVKCWKDFASKSG